MGLALHAVWTLVAEKTTLTEADLLKRINDLDAEDGTVDGRVAPARVQCSCRATVCRKFSRCLFCGKEYTGGRTFEAL
jgi:hypothetical protein